jgi:transcriptional regulator with XRE-family HTH domain
MDNIKDWVNASEKNKKEYNQEALILDVTEQIWERLEELGLKKQDLGDRLGCGKSHVTQLLNGGRNMTLRTLSDIALALESEVKIYLAETVAAKNSSVWFTKNYVNFPVANQATHTETAKFETNVYSFPKFGQNNLLERTA